jgi:hypothetical protein
MNMLGLSSSVRITHIACYWKFFLLHFNHNWTTSSRYTVPPRHARKRLFHYCVFSRCQGTTWTQSCSLATAFVLSPVYTVYTWQWIYMAQYVQGQVEKLGEVSTAQKFGSASSLVAPGVSNANFWRSLLRFVKMTEQADAYEHNFCLIIPKTLILTEDL